jgi:hypothetical protein
MNAYSDGGLPSLKSPVGFDWGIGPHAADFAARAPNWRASGNRSGTPGQTDGLDGSDDRGAPIDRRQQNQAGRNRQCEASCREKNRSCRCRLHRRVPEISYVGNEAMIVRTPRWRSRAAPTNDDFSSDELAALMSVARVAQGGRAR